MGHIAHLLLQPQEDYSREKLFALTGVSVVTCDPVSSRQLQFLPAIFTRAVHFVLIRPLGRGISDSLNLALLEKKFCSKYLGHSLCFPVPISPMIETTSSLMGMSFVNLT